MIQGLGKSAIASDSIPSSETFPDDYWELTFVNIRSLTVIRY